MYLSKNAKMKRSENSEFKRIFNWTIPAFMTKDGFKTCPMAGNCVNGCYAKMGAYIWPKVYAKHESNLKLSQSDAFIPTIDAEIKKSKADLIRIHDSGDFYSAEYLSKWIKVAELNPTVQFYAYTKMVEMVKGSILPKNLIIIFSLGGKQDHLIDRQKDRHSRVFESLEQLQSAGYIDTSHDDTNALKDNPKVGLVYHGNKGFNKTNWNKVG